MLAGRLLRAGGGAFVFRSAGVGRKAGDDAVLRQLPCFPRLSRAGSSAQKPLSRLFSAASDGLPEPLALSEKRLDAAEKKRDTAEKKRDAPEKKRDAAEKKWASHGEPDNGPYYDMLKDAQAGCILERRRLRGDRLRWQRGRTRRGRRGTTCGSVQRLDH